jgi:hypothetical protein
MCIFFSTPGGVPSPGATMNAPTPGCAFCWFAGILCLFGCFMLVDPIFGNMLQATRGIMTVVLVPLVMKATGLTPLTA